ncbi:MAG: hypothetical protein MRECE_1c100 [Mycoplasmataceae bacterium CE_OT135]|nr:MAG: hypothetical protein MRECE_1c067 [Mycoplasmataceae bacterium CE_OT135]KLL04339.1 MAG: hypothetical protein MRECE_1c100 [Mycoplasmataceae bacterium CE_OT135]
MKDWTNIHPNFIPYWKKQWKKWGFGYAETKEWIELGLEPKDVYFANWLVEEKDCTTERSSKDYIKDLRKEYTREEREKEKWAEKGFADEEREEWINTGLNLGDYNFAYYLFKENYNPQEIDDDRIWEIRKGYNEWQKSITAQEWIDYFYPLEIRSKVEELENITLRKKPNQFLKLKGFRNLKKLHCSSNELTSLDLSDCSRLEELYCSSNKLKELKLPDTYSSLRKIDCSCNELTELNWEALGLSGWLKELNISRNNFLAQDLSILGQFRWLKELRIANNNFFGSLEPLENLTELEILDISSTDIEEGIEYLPESVKFLFCDFKKNEDELSKIYQELEFFRSKSESHNYNFKEWKKFRLIQLTKKNKELEIEKQQLQEQNNFLEQQVEDLEQRLIQEGEIHREAAFSLSRQEIAVKSQRIEELKSQLANFQIREQQTQAQNWENIHFSFTPELQQAWQNHNFTSQQTQEWINISLVPQDYDFVAWLRDTKNLTPEQVLNHGDVSVLRQEFQASQQRAYIQQTP